MRIDWNGPETEAAAAVEAMLSPFGSLERAAGSVMAWVKAEAAGDAAGALAAFGDLICDAKDYLGIAGDTFEIAMAPWTDCDEAWHGQWCLRIVPPASRPAIEFAVSHGEVRGRMVPHAELPPNPGTGREAGEWRCVEILAASERGSAGGRWVVSAGSRSAANGARARARQWYGCDAPDADPARAERILRRAEWRVG